jgi:hypothetical protein
MRPRVGLLCFAVAVLIATANVAVANAADLAGCQPGAGPVAIDPSSAGGVNLHVTADGSIRWCSAQVIEANSDVPDGTNYPTRATAQSPNYNPVSNAVSVSELLTLAGVNPASVDHVEIERLNGGWSMLDHADLVDPAGSFENGLRPIFWINGAETQYLRPLRSATDANGNDQIVASAGAALDLYLYSGPLLTVVAHATPTRVAVGQAVTFTASVSNPAARAGALAYTWDFQDGSTATGASVRHHFSVAGTWYPVVTVLAAGNDSGGTSQPVAVTIGSVPTGGRAARPGGTDTSGRQHAGGPARGAGTTSHTPPTTSHAAGTSPAPARPGSASSSATRPVAKPVPTTRVKPPPAALRQVAFGGTAIVRGRLISDPIPIPTAQLVGADPAAGRAPAAAAASLGGGAISISAGVAGAGAVLLLLGSGAAVELRSRRRAGRPPGVG